MQIAVFGLGYVGAVSSACLAEMGHHVIGVDINPEKVAMIARGEAPIIEDHIAELTAEAVASGRLIATTDVATALENAEVSIVSVGTPSKSNGAIDLSYVEAVVGEIGRLIRKRMTPHTVVIRSTVPPGATQEKFSPILEEASARQLGDNLELVFNPEFLREGRSVADFRAPPFTLIGAASEEGFERVAGLYRDIPGEIIRMTPTDAESVKLLSNAWHGLKVAFANEAARLLQPSGADPHAVMEVFAKDTALNISPAYLKPGFAFGGSCLPKDLRAVIADARQFGVLSPLMQAALASNDDHVSLALSRIQEEGRKTVALFGLAFKPGTDDLRESPYVALAEKLIGKGYPLKIVDRHVDASRLMGKNLEYIEREIPHFVDLLENDAARAIDAADILVIGHASDDDLVLIKKASPRKRIIDLTGVLRAQDCAGSYEGLCW